MEYLLRDDAPFSQEQWSAIDGTVVKTARQVMVGRRFISLYGPLGAGIQSINVDDFGAVGDGEVDFFGDGEGISLMTRGRRFIEIPMVYKDFTLSWRDVESSRQNGLPLDISAAAGAAALCAKKEDELIFLGNEALGYEGLLTAQGARKIEKGSWKEGEVPFLDVARGLELLTSNGLIGRFALAVSPDLYMQLQRIQPGTGILELDRIKKLLKENVYQTPILGANKAVLVCSEPQNMDLVVGQDMITAYMGPEKLNHSLRVLETVLLRIKRRDAIIIFE